MASVKSKILHMLCALGLAMPVSLLPSSVYAKGADDNAIPEPKLSFSVISDIHLRAGRSDFGFPFHDRTAEHKFTCALKDLHRVNPHADALVIDGDLTVTGMQSDYQRVMYVLQRAAHPETTLFAMGNHEYYGALRTQQDKLNLKTFPNGMTVQKCISRFTRNTGMPNLYYDKWIQGYHFIVLGAVLPMSKLNAFDNTTIPLMELRWLKQTLNAGSASKPTFVFLHQPLPNTVAGSENSYIKNSKKLREILSQYPSVIFFSGHSHQSFRNQPKWVVQDGFTMCNTSTVRNPITPLHKKIGNSEGLYVQVFDDKVVIKQRDFTSRTWTGDYTIDCSSGNDNHLPGIPPQVSDGRNKFHHDASSVS